jgi:hypothetical protein
VSPSRRFVRAVGLFVARRLGSKIVDARTQQTVGRALVIPWRGKIHVIGLERALKVEWVPQKRLTYWKQEIAFESHPAPDWPPKSDRPPV